jgi:hypothetical protein
MTRQRAREILSRVFTLSGAEAIGVRHRSGSLEMARRRHSLLLIVIWARKSLLVQRYCSRGSQKYIMSNRKTSKTW